MHKTLPCLLLLLLVTSPGLKAGCGDTCQYYPGHSPVSIPSNYLEVLEDKSATLSTAAVLRSNRFGKVENGIINMGTSESTFWFRFCIQNNTADSSILLSVEQPLLDVIEAYIVSGNEPQLIGVISKEKPFFARNRPHISNFFDISIPPGETRTVLLKIRSASQIIFQVKVGPEEQLIAMDLRKEIRLGIYFGIMLAMIAYNLFVFFSIRDKNYLWYVIYVTFITLTQTSLPGFTFKYFWPDNTWLALQEATLFSCLAGIAALQFIREFLHAKEITPRLARGIPVFSGIFLIALVLSLAGSRMWGFLLMQFTTMLASLYALFISFLIYRLGYRPAKFFLLAWSILFIGAIVFVLKDFDVLPYNTVTTSALLISSALETLLLSFALADKINMLRKEKEESQEQAMTAMAEIAAIRKEQNIVLETKVNERTLALKQSNEELNKALLELKEAESQLVESEKMASLGQLTAGIAHEINNPTNFVTSNVKPLKRDIDMIIGLLEQVEEVAFSSASEDEKRARILELKGMLDYDYLKTEVEYLVNGIKEGSNRIVEIIKGLRTFSRLDEDDLKKASVNDGIDSTLIIVNHMLNGCIKIVKNYARIPAIECYPGELNRVFLNVITNGLQAIKARFFGAPGGIFTVTTYSDDTSIVASFKDNGVGMDKATQSKIFEPFFTTKGVNEGIGLGMSIVYNIIQKHQGKIEIRSVPGEGTELNIILPIKQHGSGNQS